MGSLNIFDFILLGSGLYLIYAGLKMKLKGEVSSFIVSKDVDMAKAKDKEGYIAFMAVRIVVLGVLTLLLGASGLLLTYVHAPVYVELVLITIFLLILVYYAVICNKARNKYV